MLYSPLPVPPPDLAAVQSATRQGSALRAQIAGPTITATARDEALGKGAPWLALFSTGCMLLVLWALVGAFPPSRLAAWAIPLLGAEIAIVRARQRRASHGGTRHAVFWRMIETTLHAGWWAALPAFAFATQPAATQLLLGGALAVMMAGAFLLALAPLSATARAATLA
jgi:hypothetical protein